MENQLKLLVISFYFPPSYLVAARRWAKHLKYARRDGLEFYVLTRAFVEGKSSWTKDIHEYSDHVARLRFEPRYTYYKSHLPKSFGDKILWKLSYWASRFIKPYENEQLGDDSIGAEKVFLEEAKKLIESKQITHVILTVGPHRFSAILLELRRQYPKLRLIIDYRDYWHDKEHDVSRNLIDKERDIESKVLEAVDGVLVVNQEMEAYFKNRLGSSKAVMTLPHCFDPDDIPAASPAEQGEKALRFIYGGALYSRMDNHIRSFLRFAEALQKKGLQTDTRLYVPFGAYDTIFKSASVPISVEGIVDTSEYFGKVLASDYVLYFRPDWSPNAFSSKFFELLALRKPMLYFGPASEVSEFLETQGLGIHIPEAFSDAMVDRFLDKSQFVLNRSYDLDAHSFGGANQLLYAFLREGAVSKDKPSVTKRVEHGN